MRIAMCLLWAKVFNVIGSGLSDVCSGTSMTTCCVVNANMDPGDLGNQYYMTKHENPSDSLLIARKRFGIIQMNERI